jgi:hypothetical protein
MTIRHPGKRTLLATLTVLCAAALSFAVYELSASIGNAFAHELVAKLAGTAYFLAVAFGSFYVYLAASLDDAPFAHRVIGALATPFLWMTKECVRLFESHPLLRQSAQPLVAGSRGTGDGGSDPRCAKATLEPR